MQRIDDITLEDLKSEFERISTGGDGTAGHRTVRTVNPTLTDCHETSIPQDSALLDSPEAKLLRRLHQRWGSWGKVGAKLDLNKGLVWMVAQGKIQSPTVSAKLKGNHQQLWDEAR